MEPTQQAENIGSVESREPNHKALLASILALIILTVGAVYLAGLSEDQSVEENIFTSEGITIRTAPTVLETAPEGALVAGFPEDLILAEDAVLEESQLLNFITYYGGKEAVSVGFNTGLDADLMRSRYLEYLTGEGYSIDKEAVSEGSTIISARRGDSYLGVSITSPLNGGSKVKLISITIDQ